MKSTQEHFVNLRNAFKCVLESQLVYVNSVISIFPRQLLFSDDERPDGTKQNHTIKGNSGSDVLWGSKPDRFQSE